MVDVGGLYRITYDVYDGTGTLVNASTISLTLFLPDGSSAGVTTFGAPSPTGHYQYDYQTTVKGRHTGVITTTNPNTTKGLSFDVEEVPSTALVGLADMKNYLNETGTTNDDEITEFMLVATDIIEDKTGSIVRRNITNEYQPVGQSLWLKQYPIISITSINPYLTIGVGYPVNMVTIDKASGRVQRLDGFPFVGGPFAVNYVAGLETVMPSLRHSAKIITAHLWETQRGGMTFLGSGPGPTADDEMFFSRGKEYSVPRRALETIKPSNMGPRVA